MSLPQFDTYAPAHLSFSAVNAYRTCPNRFRLERVEKREQRPGIAGFGGNVVHTVTEWYDDPERAPEGVWADDEFQMDVAVNLAWAEELEKRREQSPSYSIEDFVVTGKAAVKYGGKRNIEWWRDNIPVMVQRWIDWRASSGWSIWTTPQGRLAVEVAINIVLPGDVPEIMFIDRVMVTPVGQLVVVDIKTGARMPDFPEQLGFYALGIEKEFGLMYRPDFGYFWDANKGVHSSPLELGRYTESYFAEDHHMAIAGINAGAFQARPQNNCKDWCSVARFCRAVGGSLASA